MPIAGDALSILRLVFDIAIPLLAKRIKVIAERVRRGVATPAEHLAVAVAAAVMRRSLKT